MSSHRNSYCWYQEHVHSKHLRNNNFFYNKRNTNNQNIVYYLVPDEPQKAPAGRSSPSHPRPTPSPSLVEDNLVTRHLTNDRPKPKPKALCTTLLDKDSYVPVYAQDSVLLIGSDKQKSVTTVALNESFSSTSTTSTLNKSNCSNIGGSKTASDFPDGSHFGDDKQSTAIQLDEAICQVVLLECSVDDDCGQREESVDAVKQAVIEVVEDDSANSDNYNDDDDDDKTFEYTDDDLEEALQSEPEFHDDDPKTPTNQADASFGDCNEGHYMPMTPRKSILSLSESNIFVSTMEQPHESPYVEMTTIGLSTSVLADDYKSTYELITFNTNHKRTESEPVYMELSQFKHAPPTITVSVNKTIEKVINNGKSTIKKSSLKKCNIDAKKRQKKLNNLPDILKPSQGAVVLNSDSSDADDESSKDVDSMAHRSRSRFSLSDTFRPASYYLGATRPLAECPDSSDSEIVSPPPIPSSPPPIEELKTEEIFSSENYDTVKRRSVDKSILNLSYDQIPKIHSSSSSLNSIKKEGLKTSRLSLPDHFAKQQLKPHKKTDDNEQDYGFLSPYRAEPQAKRTSESSFSYNTDNSSIASSDYDLYNKVKMQSPSFSSGAVYSSNTSSPLNRYQHNDSETDSIEIRPNCGSDYERQMKRRPLSEDSLSEIESLGKKFDEQFSNADLDIYLNKLQTNDLYLYQNTGDSNWMNESKLANIPFIKPPEVFRNENDDSYYGNNSFHQNDSLLKKIEADGSFRLGEMLTASMARPSSSQSTTNGTYYDSLEEKHTPSVNQIPSTSSSLKERNLSLHDAQCESEDLRATFSAESSSDQQTVCAALSAHSRTNSNLSDQSVPYYYADIVAKVQSPHSSAASSNMDISPKSGHSQNGSQLHPQLNNLREVGLKRTGISHIQNPINRRSFINDRLAGDHNSLSMELINSADKDRLIDSKILFGTESKIEKNVCKELSSGYAGNKLYGKQESARSKTPVVVHQPKDDNRCVAQPQQPSKVKNSSLFNTNLGTVVYDSPGECRPVLNPDASGDRLWEEDDIWQESLRRVSHRHARSMDSLDRLEPTSPRHNLGCAAAPPALPKNHHVREDIGRFGPLPPLPKEVTQSHTRTLKKCRRSEPPTIIPSHPYNENDVYVQLAMEQHRDVYERLKEDNVPQSRKSIEINREIIRQWDSMSSGLMKSGGPISAGGHGATTLAGASATTTPTSSSSGGSCRGGQEGLDVVDAHLGGSTSGHKLGRTSQHQHNSKSYHVV